MRVIGITGGSGCGKTTLLKEIEALGGFCIDCDKLYHRLLDTDPQLQKALSARFPAAFEDGLLQRKRLGNIVFSDPAALADLNKITHHFVCKEVRRLLAKSKAKLAAIDAIALFESGLNKLCHVTVAVTAPQELRITRLMEREGISRDYAHSRLQAQKTDAEFSRMADYRLCNQSSKEEFIIQCQEFLKGAIPMEEKKYESLRKELLNNPKNGYDRISDADLAAMEPYCKEYMDFISTCKIEREAVDWTIAEAEKHGFKPLVPGMELKPGDKVYGNGHG